MSLLVLGCRCLHAAAPPAAWRLHCHQAHLQRPAAHRHQPRRSCSRGRPAGHAVSNSFLASPMHSCVNILRNTAMAHHCSATLLFIKIGFHQYLSRRHHTNTVSKPNHGSRFCMFCICLVYGYLYKTFTRHPQSTVHYVSFSNTQALCMHCYQYTSFNICNRYHHCDYLRS